ncbi:MAG: hypothetical protein IKZ88_06105 [Neisseriaceae bacterium]|nr:hypothetical protein [Neisseriaceae bacterium]
MGNSLPTLFDTFSGSLKNYCHYEHSRKAMRSNLLTMENGNAKMFWLTPNFVSGSLNG